MNIFMANILLADDDEMLLDLYQMKFGKSGHKVAAVREYKEVLPQIESAKPDVVLLDRRLGAQDGLALLAEIRKSANGKNIPVIVLTNMDPTLEDIAAVRQLGPAEYLIKEKVELNDLVKKVSELAGENPKPD